jgi:hypothetical protein
VDELLVAGMVEDSTDVVVVKEVVVVKTVDATVDV